MLKPGDRFILAGMCVKVEGSRGMSVDVTECAGQSPTVPRWFSGMMSMEAGLAERMRHFREKIHAIAPAGEKAIARMLMRQYSACPQTAAPAAAYLFAQHRYADIPVDGELLIERVPDEAQGPLGGPACVLVFHTMIGRAANEALARLVAFRMQERFGMCAADLPEQTPNRRRGNFHGAPGATVVVDDYAFGIWIEASKAARRADRTLIRSLLSPRDFQADLLRAVETSDLFRTQFRFTAIRAQAILQNKFGRRRFIGQMHGHAQRLYEALREHHPDHPLIRETRRTVLDDILRAPAALDFLERLTRQSLRLLDLATPSPFAFGLFATSRLQGYPAPRRHRRCAFGDVSACARADRRDRKTRRRPAFFLKTKPCPQKLRRSYRPAPRRALPPDSQLWAFPPLLLPAVSMRISSGGTPHFPPPWPAPCPIRCTGTPRICTIDSLERWSHMHLPIMPLANLGSIFGIDGFVLLIFGLLIFGRRLPEVGKNLGKTIVEFKKGLNGVTGEEEQPDAKYAAQQPPTRQLSSSTRVSVAPPARPARSLPKTEEV